MKRDDIIINLYNEHLFDKLANTYASKIGDYKDDFIQHLYLIVCEMPEDKLIGLYDRGELNYYLYYIARAAAFNDKSEFNQLHKGRLDISYSLDDPNYQELNEDNYE